MSEFEKDLAKAKADAKTAREELLVVIRSLKDEDLGRERRGGWPIKRVLDHAIHSEVLYARLARHLRELPQPDEDAVTVPPASVADAVSGLEDSRAALDEAIDGVDEETFYRMRIVGHEEYSILSLLENVTLHDREHGPQIQEILAATA